MKKTFILIATLLLSAGAFAQAPESMSYQAVVRDANQALVSNQSVGTQITILQGSMAGTVVYSEEHNTVTNINGLSTFKIGEGTVVSGDFSTIDWSSGPYFIQTDTDPTGGTNYTITGVSQMLSVPYALYAESSGSSIPGPQGIQGPQGIAGNDGIDGATGPAGLDGADGIDGIDGAVGPQGPQGFTGLDGADGIDGIDGATGPQGPQGIQGVAGNDGVDGIDGAVGPAGLDGADGIDGVDGIDGAVGPAGLDGADGIDGIDGATGPQGIQGVAGLDGIDGVDGIDGAVGPAGLDGADGVDGAVGPAGTYTAGTGIDITAGVISATGTTAAEYLMVSPDAISAGYVSFGSASAVNGIAYNATTDEFTLKAGKTYMLEGAVYMHTTTSSVTYSFVFYDKTNSASIGTEAYQRTADYSGTIINQPIMSAIITPVTDIQVGIKDVYGATGGFISTRGFFRVIELK